MIYIKRILWLLGYPIMWVLSCALFIVAVVFIGFKCLYLYIKNGDIEVCNDPIEWVVKIIDWYNDIEPKED